MEDDIEKLSTVVFGPPEQPQLGLIQRVTKLEAMMKETSEYIAVQHTYNKIMVFIGSSLFVLALAELWKLIVRW